MIPYILTFTLTALCMSRFQKVDRVGNKYEAGFWAVLTVLLPTILGAMRAVTLGTDNTRYYPMFLQVADMGSPIEAITSGSKEPGYELLCYIVSRFTTDYHWLCFFTELITMAFIFAGIYYYRDYISMSLGILVYLFLQYCNNINLVRQGMAVAICFYAIHYVYEKKFWKFAIFVILAALFHMSALGVLLIYFMFRFLERGNYAIKLVVICIVLFLAVYYMYYIVRILVSLHILASKYLKYFSPGFHFSLKHTVFCLPVLIVASLLYKPLSIKFSQYKYLYALLWVELIIVQLADTFDPAYRISLYCSYIDIIALPMFPKAFNKRTRIIAYLIVIMYLVAYWVFFTVFNRYGFSYPVYPYITDLF